MLLGDYIHGESENYEVLDKIMNLQDIYGTDKVVALMGNHEEFILLGYSTVNDMIKPFDEEVKYNNEEKYIHWIKNLPRYFTLEDF